MNSERVLGVDACRGGWFGIVLDGDRVTGHQENTIAALLTAAEQDGAVSVVAIDIPIGLPDDGPREADLEAKTFVGPRAPSVFPTPVRATLGQSHQVANETNRARTGKGLSQQAYALLPKIQEVDSWLPGVRPRVVEVHPEVSFRAMAGAHVETRKSTWAGVRERTRLLLDHGIVIPDDLDSRRAGVDDVLDAAAAAWTACRVVGGKATSIPGDPQSFSDRLTCAIWY